MTPLKKCIECGDEWITDQHEVVCLQTQNKVILVTIDEAPIEIDEPYLKNPCKAGRHQLSKSNWYRLERKNGRVEEGCLQCRRERNLAAVLRYKARKKTSLPQ